jgi:hypothetical protein
MSRLIWYPVLTATALACAEPCVSQGLAGLPETFARFGAAVSLILADPTDLA